MLFYESGSFPNAIIKEYSDMSLHHSNLCVPVTVENSPGYNSWPMLQADSRRLVCLYSRGKGHTIVTGDRNLYARISRDGGKSWEAEITVSALPEYSEIPIGKGVDSQGRILFWVRCGTPQPPHFEHVLYRLDEDETFRVIAQPHLQPVPMQITDLFFVPTVGLTALWFATDYQNHGDDSWGMLISRDDGVSWEQRTIEDGLPLSELPTEPAAVYVGDGKILAVARTENRSGGAMQRQWQLESSDCGKSWTRRRTNIGDVCLSTPTLIFDPSTGTVSNYYYQRGEGRLLCRTTGVEAVWQQPEAWPEPEVVAMGSTEFADAGNTNATVSGAQHLIAYYTGVAPQTNIVIIARHAPPPRK